MNSDEYRSELPELLTLDEVAEILKVKRQTLYTYINRTENPLPIIHINNNVPRVILEELKKWIKSLPDPRQDV